MQYLDLEEVHGCLVVVAQWQSTGCTSQVFWAQFPAVGISIFASKHLNSVKDDDQRHVANKEI